jgi:hypothetical protein
LARFRIRDALRGPNLGDLGKGHTPEYGVKCGQGPAARLEWPPSSSDASSTLLGRVKCGAWASRRWEGGRALLRTLLSEIAVGEQAKKRQGTRTDLKPNISAPVRESSKGRADDTHQPAMPPL